VDPTYQWHQIVGADRYRLIVSKYADFGATYDNVYTDYNDYTPYEGGSQDAYPNGTYYWKVEALNHNNAVITTSEARSFTKEETLPLVAPADAVTGLTVDPTFRWNRIVGADRFHLIVSKYADFSATYDNGYCDYNDYTPYEAGSQDAYPNGTYYWKVEALNHNNAVITTSEARSFTKAEPLPLVAPTDSAALLVDPSFQWNWIVGADRYHLTVSKYADFHATYDNVYCDYNRYRPYEARSQTHYPPGVYYWKVEALNHNNIVITTSSLWDFTIDWPEKLYMPLTQRGS
jgi:large repetitive protein